MNITPSQKTIAGWRMCFALLMVFSVAHPFSASAAQLNADWIGGTGNWNDAANWNPNTVPNNDSSDTFNVRIDNGDGGTNSEVSLDINRTIDNLAIDVGDRLEFNNAQSLTIAADNVGAGTIVNAGSIGLNSTGSSTSLVISGGDVTLSGGGTVTLSNNTNNFIVGVPFALDRRLINEDNTIQGAGRFGSNFLALTNRGTIDANQTNFLTIDTNATGGINSGTIQATGVGILLIRDSNIANFEGGTEGLIRADNASVRLLDGSVITGGNVEVVGAGEIVLDNATITGGTLTNSATGVIRASGSGVTSRIGGTLNNVAGGQIILDVASRLVLEAGVHTNAGSIDIDGASGSTQLAIEGDVTLTGGGTVTLSKSARFSGSTASGNQLINVDNTIQGAGTIGRDSMALTNQGTIDANQTETLTIDTSDTTGGINSGTIRATGGGTLVFADSNIENFDGLTNGLILADNSIVKVQGVSVITGGNVEVVGTGEIQLSFGTITGGTLTNSATGVIRTFASTPGAPSTIGGTLNNVAGGQVIVSNNTRLRLEAGGTYTNAGTIALNSIGNTTELVIVGGGDVTLTGGGTLTMSNNSNNRITGDFDAATNRLINADNNIEGAGQIGRNRMALTNGGTIDANQTNSLTIDPLGGTGANVVLNTGTMRASNTGNLILKDGAFNNNGTIEALNGGSVVFAAGSSAFNTADSTNNDGAGTLTGGTWNVFAGSTIDMQNPADGNILTNNANVLLSGLGSIFADIDTLADNQGNFSIRNDRDFNTLGALSNSGGVNLGENSTLNINGNYTQIAGSLTLENATSLVIADAGAGIVDIQGGTLSGIGDIVGSVINDGAVNPGLSPGILNIMGDYDQLATGTLNIELGGTGLGLFDQLNIAGFASLDGLLNVSLFEGFFPTVGDEFQVMTFDSSVGTFDSFIGLDIGGGLALTPVLSGTDLTLLTVPGTAIPEPSTLVIGIAFAGLTTTRRRNRT